MASSELLDAVIPAVSEQIRNRYFRMMSRLAPRYDVEDLVQQVIMETFADLHLCKAETEDQMKGWMMFVARNKAARLYWINRTYSARTMTREKVAIGVATDQSRDGFQPQDDNDATGLDSLVDAEKKQYIAQAIASLNERQQEVIRLRYFDGMQLVQIAKVLGISADHVRSISRIALRKLAEAIDLANVE